MVKARDATVEHFDVYLHQNSANSQRVKTCINIQRIFKIYILEFKEEENIWYKHISKIPYSKDNRELGKHSIIYIIYFNEKLQSVWSIINRSYQCKPNLSHNINQAINFLSFKINNINLSSSVLCLHARFKCYETKGMEITISKIGRNVHLGCKSGLRVIISHSFVCYSF